jgi:hypothetical protein
MTDHATSGTEHLIICLEILHDLCAQLVGDPISVIESVRRSGVLVPASGIVKVPGLSFEERERAAEERLELLLSRKAKQDAVQQAINVVQGIVRDLQTAPACDPIVARS